jgi:hypothetical protein
VKVIFSSLFKRDMLEAEARYAEISPRLAEDFHVRVKEVVRVIIKWKGGDHVGAHGYPGRKCRPFPHVVYYEIKGDKLFVLGLVHERRRPDYLRENLEEKLG